MAKLLIYTRKPIDNIHYDNRLAYSVHLAISDDGVKYTALNHNSGVLFPKATENEDGSLNPKCLKSPRIIKENGTYRIIAIRTDGEGEKDPESEGKFIEFYTADFVTYEENSLKDMTDAAAYAFNEKISLSMIDVKDIEGCVPESITDISDQVKEKLLNVFTTPRNIGIDVPMAIKVSSAYELNNLKITLRYSDGSTARKSVKWKLDNVDFYTPGEYEIEGEIEVPHFEFPIMFDRADPCIGRWNGRYYFIATNDADENHTLYIRESDTIEGLLHAEEHLLLDSSTYPEIKGLLWAPEFHVINNTLYIFHAATPGHFFEEESCIMELKKGGNPIKKEDWSRPVRIVKADGSNICEAGKEITLDMTEFEFNDDHYVIWSQRQFLPKDLGAWLYIAKINPQNPMMLASEPVVLSKPDYGWGNNHTFVEEGPFALYKGDKLFITFSAAAVDTSYVVGLLSINKGDDPLIPSNWTKKGYPILTSRSVPGEYGTGHNAFVTDSEGNIWNTYHARPGTEGPRSSGIRRVHFNIYGEPVLDMTEEIDVAEEFKHFKTKLILS